jgi:endonuclease G
VAWRITRADLGKLDREDSFRPDDRLPKAGPRVTPSDYTGSGFDRGHVCPNADRYASREAADATFLMTNMTPQTGDLNRGPWQKLEAYLRRSLRAQRRLHLRRRLRRQRKNQKEGDDPANNWKSRSSCRPARRFPRSTRTRA